MMLTVIAESEHYDADSDRREQQRATLKAQDMRQQQVRSPPHISLTNSEYYRRVEDKL